MTCVGMCYAYMFVSGCVFVNICVCMCVCASLCLHVGELPDKWPGLTLKLGILWVGNLCFIFWNLLCPSPIIKLITLSELDAIFTTSAEPSINDAFSPFLGVCEQLCLPAGWSAWISWTYSQITMLDACSHHLGLVSRLLPICLPHSAPSDPSN